MKGSTIVMTGQAVLLFVLAVKGPLPEAPLISGIMLATYALCVSLERINRTLNKRKGDQC